MARTLRQLFTAYRPGHVLRHAGRDFTFSRLSLGQMGALVSAWRSVHGSDDEPAPGPFGEDVPLGPAFGHCLSNAGILALAAAMTDCEPDELAPLLYERRGELRHVCLCVLLASEGVFRDAMLTWPDNHVRAAQMAQLVEGFLGRN
jgi:hypothetical protein